MAKKTSHTPKPSVPKPAPSSPTPSEDFMKLPNFLSTFRDNLQNDHDTRYCFVLGSGASISSGIRSGASLVNDWLQWLHEQDRPGEPESALQAWAEKEFKKWPGFTWEKRAEFYGCIYAERFVDDANGQEWLRKIMASAKPSFGYTVLAQIIATTKHNVVITTNFDNLVQEALNLIGQPRSFIAHSPAEAKFIGQNDGRPRLLKIHGDIDRETYNRDNLIENLDPAWHDALRHILDIYTPIFIGYGGCDPGFMHFLNNIYHLTPNRRRPLWTYRVAAGELKNALPPSATPPGYPSTDFVGKFMKEHQAFWVPTPGFDELMLLLSPALDHKYDAASVRAAAEQTAQDLEKSRTDACRTARSHDGTHWCPQLDALTKAAELHHLGEVGRWRMAEWREYIAAGVGPAEKLARCEEAIQKLPDEPWAYSLAAIRRSDINPTDPKIDSLLDQAGDLLKSGSFADNSEEAMLVLHHKGQISLSRGNAQEAEGIYRDLVSKRLAKSGAEHPDTLGARNNLANALQGQRKKLDAEQEHRAVLAIRLRVHGAEHLDTLKSRHNLANTLRGQGKHTEAEQEHRAVLAIMQRVLGAEDPDVLTSCFNLASCLEDQDKLLQALEFMQRAEAGRRKVLGEEHPLYKKAKAGVTRIQQKLRAQQQ